MRSMTDSANNERDTRVRGVRRFLTLAMPEELKGQQIVIVDHTDPVEQANDVISRTGERVTMVVAYDGYLATLEVSLSPIDDEFQMRAFDANARVDDIVSRVLSGPADAFTASNSAGSQVIYGPTGHREIALAG